MNEIDILSIHSDILKSFAYKRENIDKYREKLHQYTLTKDISTLSIKIKNDIQLKITQLENYIYNIETNELENFYITGRIITRVTDIKFLGVILDENLSWILHTEYD